MTELDRDRGAAFLGFTVSAALLVLTVGTYFNDSLSHLGWQGGEYAYAFLWIAIGSTVVGGVIKFAAPAPWRSIGAGLAVGGIGGVLVVLVLIVTFFVLLATNDWGISVP
ncbi:hypothetical protein [Lentzea sp. NPDC004782]|uniref:hypothetical protein n=1 Tax=Lentzea sp. NPDC004782 TaxID=3154458 RepID=UPI0033ABFB17